MLWPWKEQDKHVIELWKKEIQINKTGNGMQTEKYYFVHARDGTGGEKKYFKLHPKWGRKNLSKWTGCPCHLEVKLYPGTSHVFGMCTIDHDHPIGEANAMYTWLLDETQCQLKKCHTWELPITKL